VELSSNDNKKERDSVNGAVSCRLGKLFKEEYELTLSFGISVITPEDEVCDNNEIKQEAVPDINNIVGKMIMIQKPTKGTSHPKSFYQNETNSELEQSSREDLMKMESQ
jgi:hypothetical protein